MPADIEDNFYLELLRAYIDSTDDALFVLCDEMKFLLCNHAGENYFGLKESTLTEHNQRMPITELLSDQNTIDLFFNKYPRVLEGEAIRFETFMQPVNAESHWVEFCLNLVAVENVPMVIVVARNINHRKQLETDLLNQRKELEILVNERTHELQLANQHKDRLFSIIAHDLRTPFTPILGYAETIINQADSLPAETLRNYATKIHNSGKYSLNLLSDLLEWSQLQLNGVTVTKISFNLNDVARNAINQLSAYSSNKQVLLNNNIPRKTAHIDRHIIETVIRNLVSNAIKFTPAGGIVNIDLNNNGNAQVISVTDTGSGINYENLEKILSGTSFESIPGTENEKGTGFGLPLCINLIEKHGGKLSAESSPGKGSCFSFTF